MNKYLIITSLAVLALVSCKKDYSCTCTETSTYDGSVDIYTTTKTIVGATKSEAIGACNEAVFNYTDPDDGYNYKQECKLSK